MDPNTRHHIPKRSETETVNNISKDFRAAFSCPDLLLLLQPRHGTILSEEYLTSY